MLAAAGALATARIHTDRMAEAAQDSMLLATDLAETLGREGGPFREAHEVVGRSGAHCVQTSSDLRSLSRSELQDFHSAFPSDAGVLLDLERSFSERNLVGGTAKSRVEGALAEAPVATEPPSERRRRGWSRRPPAPWRRWRS